MLESRSFRFIHYYNFSILAILIEAIYVMKHNNEASTLSVEFV